MLQPSPSSSVVVIFSIVFILLSFCCSFSSAQIYVDERQGKNRTDCSDPSLPCDSIYNAMMTVTNKVLVRIVMLSNVRKCELMNNVVVKELEIVGSEKFNLDCRFVVDSTISKMTIGNFSLGFDFSISALQSTIILENVFVESSIIAAKSVVLTNAQTGESSSMFISASSNLDIVNSVFYGRFSAWNDYLKYSKTYITNSVFRNCVATVGLEASFTVTTNYRDLTVKSCLFYDSVLLVKDNSKIDIRNSLFNGNYKFYYTNYEQNVAALFITSYSPSSLVVYNSIFTNNNLHGGVRLVGAGINSFFSNCTFSDNSNYMGGAALYLQNIYASVIHNSIFINNVFTKLNSSYNSYRESEEMGGGAIFQRQSIVTTTNCSFINNKANGGIGGAILVIHSSIFNSENDLFLNNSAMIGGAFASLDTNAFLESTITGTTFANNSAVKMGGAMFVFKCKKITAASEVFFNGNQANYGGAIYSVSSTFVLDRDPIVFKDNYESGKNGELVLSDFKSFPDSFSLNITDIIGGNKNFNFRFGQRLELAFTLNSKQTHLKSDFIGKNPLSLEIKQSEGVINDFMDSSYENIVKTTFYSYSMQSKPFTFTVTLHFNTLKSFTYSISDTFTVEPLVCEPMYWYDMVVKSQINNQPVYGCGFNWLSVLPFVFFGIIFISAIIVCLSMFGYIKIKGMKMKLRILDKKEQAEVELNQRLIQLEQLYTSEVQNKYYMKDWMIKIEDIKIISKIGEGGMGVVYRGMFSMHEVALKSVKLDTDDLESNEFETEASILSSSRHPNIVGFYGVCITDSTRFMVTEYISGGSLDSLIYHSKIKNRHITLPTKISILLGIANGMNYLHSGKNGIVIHHRDLKPANILLTNDLIPKVCDFGLSKLSQDSGKSSKTTNIGTLYFIAPEMLLGKDYNHTIDVFSFSIIMWQLIFDESLLYDSSYTTNPKFTKIMNAKEMEQYSRLVDSSYILVPKLVTEGLRLPIPQLPLNSNELRDWIYENFINEDLQVDLQYKWDSFDIYSNSLGALFELMRKCWQDSIIDRPSFNVISKELSTIRNLFK